MYKGRPWGTKLSCYADFLVYEIIVVVSVHRIIVHCAFIYCAQDTINKLVKSHGGLMTTEFVAEAFFRFDKNE